MIKKNSIYTAVVILLLVATNVYGINTEPKKDKGLTSIETGYTIHLVRTALHNKKTQIIASSYEGIILAYDYDGKLLWKNALSGFMNHDIWCADLDGDNTDEILVANATGKVYCLNNKGEILWEFSKNEAPFKSVTTIAKDGKMYVVAGSYDTHMYYLDAKGKEVLDIPTTSFSLDKAKHKNSKEIVKAFVTNYIRPAKYADGSDILVVHGIATTNSNGSFYYFKPLEAKPFKKEKNKTGRLGDIRVVDINNDGVSEILLGKTGEANKGSGFFKADFNTEKIQEFNISKLYRKLDAFGYRVTQPEFVKDVGKEKYLVLFGSRIILSDMEMNVDKAELLACKYSFNDMWNDKKRNNIILASVQSGGSCIHIINLNNKEWKTAYRNLNPPGKIQTILDNTAEIRKGLKEFKKPKDQRASQPVYFMSESRKDVEAKKAIERIEATYDNPVFLIKPRTRAKENWDRSSILNEKYRTKRDKRMKYTALQNDLVSDISSYYKDGQGISYWAGHGNDPYMFQRSTTEKVLDRANGKKTVLVYPELEDHSDNFKYVMDDLIYPLANYSRDKNAKIFVRTKHLFWQSSIYRDNWSRLISGEFSDVFVPAMEETTDKSMELSLAARLGIWSSSATDSWGARCARDNASFDRSRQHAHQMLPNHFLRTMVYSIANGAQYLDNFAVDQKYMSLLWDLIAKGALYVPKRSEILSFSPVHLSIIHPDERYIEYGNDVKPVVFYNKDEEANNPMVFGRLNGNWPGAPNTSWDFSNYAAGAKERRLNFIPTYNNGLVLLTPPQNDTFKSKDSKRTPLDKNLHPIYKGKMKEYVTDGRQYLSKDGETKHPANTFYKVVKDDIEASSKALLPLTVSGELGWVVAQIAPNILRLTLVDSGYINPEERIARVYFNKNIKIVKIHDVLNEEVFKMNDDKEVMIKIPLGGFRFIDVQLSDSL